jgi:small subunit ribosomal protein S15
LSITTEKKSELVSTFGASESDTGNTKVQVALMSERIRNLTEHLKIHKKDFATRRGLLTLIGKRRRLLNYLQSRDSASYSDLIKKLELRR